MLYSTVQYLLPRAWVSESWPERIESKAGRGYHVVQIMILDHPVDTVRPSACTEVRHIP